MRTVVYNCFGHGGGVGEGPPAAIHYGGGGVEVEHVVSPSMAPPGRRGPAPGGHGCRSPGRAQAAALALRPGGARVCYSNGKWAKAPLPYYLLELYRGY